MKVKHTKTTQFAEYELEFYDGFDHGHLDRTKWVAAYLPQWSHTAVSAPSYTFRENTLILRIDHDQPPWCPEFDGPNRVSSLQTGVYSGALGSTRGQHHFRTDLRVREAQDTQKLYTPHLGYIEIRAKCRLAPQNLAAFWMIGFEEVPEQSAEICIVGLKGHNLRENRARIGYGVHPFGDPLLADEFYEEPFDIDVREFQTYAVEWMERALHFYVNDHYVRTIHQSPNYAMQFMLNIYDLQGKYDANVEYCIDYVVGYRCVKHLNQ